MATVGSVNALAIRACGTDTAACSAATAVSALGAAEARPWSLATILGCFVAAIESALELRRGALRRRSMGFVRKAKKPRRSSATVRTALSRTLEKLHMKRPAFPKRL